MSVICKEAKADRCHDKHCIHAKEHEYNEKECGWDSCIVSGCMTWCIATDNSKDEPDRQPFPF